MVIAQKKRREISRRTYTSLCFYIRSIAQRRNLDKISYTVINHLCRVIERQILRHESTQAVLCYSEVIIVANGEQITSGESNSLNFIMGKIRERGNNINSQGFADGFQCCKARLIIKPGDFQGFIVDLSRPEKS